MGERFIRTKLLIGSEKLDILRTKHVAVFGVGGVGGYVCEALARCGIGRFTIVDRDTVNESNINRQIIALTSTVGRAKVDVMKERMCDINPDVYIEACEVFYLPQNASEFDFTKYDYVVDAVDTVSAKLQIITAAKEANVPVISSMGAGNKLDPSLFRIADISKTSVCPLAKVMRRELKNRGLKDVKCVYSTEEAIKPEGNEIGSLAFVPSVAGLLIASEVIKDLIEQDQT
ncbi:MAG: tRNA threonylcarbamoyladenosine dehydratase [Lachnospiraceae bacterium]|nr:tRNA threonylcarbamoyladenosine dehydratase [Lachnospiraceae bacterium]